MKRMLCLLVAVIFCLFTLVGCKNAPVNRKQNDSSPIDLLTEPINDKYDYSAMTISSGNRTISPIQTFLEACDYDSTKLDLVIRSEDGTGVQGLFENPDTLLSDFPVLVATDKINVSQLSQCIGFSSPEIFDLNYKKLSKFVTWNNLHLLAPGEYIVSFTEYIETDVNSEGIYQSYRYENVFMLLIEDVELSDIPSENVKYDGEKYILVLPKTKIEIPIPDSYVRYLCFLDDDMLKNAEEAISSDMSGYIGIQIYTNQLCLYREWITHSGNDHKHHILNEPITAIPE